MNNWHVITGGPSTGKTTLIAELANKGYTTVSEAARVVIDQALINGKTVKELRANEKNFQEIVLQYKTKIEQSHSAELLTFFDRGMHDTLAYLRLQSQVVEDWVAYATKTANYKQVFLLDPLETYVKDYARTETQDEALKLNQLILEAYTEHGMEPIRVPALTAAERADFILRRIH